MIYAAPIRPAHILANIAGAVLVGLLFAAIGLDVAAGCGQNGGQCIAVSDFTGQPTRIAQQ